MRILFSVIGSRGDVQPVVALASQLQEHGHTIAACVPPDFRSWLESLGIEVTPVGPEVRRFAVARPAASPPKPLSSEDRRRMAEATVATQFETLLSAAQGCDVIVAASALQVAARSVAEKQNIPYVFAAFAPVVLPSPNHAPPPLPPVPGQVEPQSNNNIELWARDSERFHDLFGAAVNAQRKSLGLSEIADLRGHMTTLEPWLAADPTLGPWPGAPDLRVLQTGAWVLPDHRPLPPDLDKFLEEGDPPVYFGFGSTAAPDNLATVALQAARKLGRRAVISQGWSEAPLAPNEPDCLSVAEANLNALFPRVAAVVHHGGAGTTTAAAMAGAPQVIVPSIYDQHYWAQRVVSLGLGSSLERGAMTADSLAEALVQSLRPDVLTRARALASTMVRDGTRIAAENLLAAVPHKTQTPD